MNDLEYGVIAICFFVAGMLFARHKKELLCGLCLVFGLVSLVGMLFN